MVACSSNLRSPFSLPNLLLSSLNLLLFLLSAVSFAPLLLLRTPPSPFGWALFAVSSATLLSTLLGFCSHLTRSSLFFVSHVSVLILSSIGQALGFFSLLLRPDPTLVLIGPKRRPKEVRALHKIEEWALAAMLALGSIVLVLECLVQSWWAKEYEEIEAAVASAKKKTRINNNCNNNNNNNRRMGRVRVQSVVESEAKEREEGNEFEHCV